MAGGDKKRKRSGDGNSEARKKANVQTQGQPSSIKVYSVKTVQDCPPVIATSPGLCLPKSLSFKAYSEPEPSTSKRSKKTAPPSGLLLHSSAHEKMDYTAKEEGPGGRESHLKHYIGVFDPETGRLSVMEAKKMTVRAVVRARKPPQDDRIHQAPSKSMMEMRNELGETFGTKKARKAIASIAENAIAKESVTSSTNGTPIRLKSSSQALMNQIGETTENFATLDELQAAVDQGKMLPPGNFDADDIHDVYKPAELIGADIMKAIRVKDWQDAVKKNQPVSMRFQFIINRMLPVVNGPNPVQRLQMLRYLAFLLQVHHAKKPGKERGAYTLPKRDKLNEQLNTDTIIVDSIIRKFSERGTMRKKHTELLIMYCCVLGAILANYDFETAQLRNDLGLDEKDFAKYFNEIGGKIRISTGKEKGRMQRGVLSLPLEFPKTRTFRRR